MEEIDTAVIGAGVVGLAAALAIARRGRRVCVLERERRAGLGTSTRNSQVIHAGIYYPTGSLKARHCVEGARMLYAFCERHAVPHRRSGKLIVGGEDDVAAIERLLASGTANGVAGLDILDGTGIAAREPQVRGHLALLSANTGIVDAEALVRALARLCASHEAVILPAAPVIAAEPRAGGIELRTTSERILARSVVNAAGLFADDVSRQLGGRPFTIRPCRGEYAELVPSRRALVNALVYPYRTPTVTASACT